MPSNEEKPRKTWVMFKKADQGISFDSNIIPKFNKSLTTTDEHGTWTVSYSHSSNQAPYMYSAFDHSTDTYASSHKNQSKYTHYVLLQLPEGFVVSPETIVSKVKDTFNQSGFPTQYDVHVRGLNHATGEWDILTETHTAPNLYKVKEDKTKFTTFTDTVLTTKQFYSAFRFYIQRTKNQSLTDHGLWLIEYEIVKGRYMKV